MKKYIQILALTLTGFTICALLFNSCKKKYDQPTTTNNNDPNLHVTCGLWYFDSTGAAMRVGSARQIGAAPGALDTIVYGIVTANDKTGNFYKEIVIQDDSGNADGITGGGMTIALAQSSGLFTTFPIGQKVYVKLNGLYLVNVNGLPEIGAGLDPTNGGAAGIIQPLISTYLIPATYPNTVTPISTTLDRIDVNPNRYLNMLVTLNEVQFAPANINICYDTNSVGSLTIEGCTGGTITMYNSSYASFAAAHTPAGNGTATGIYTTYKAPPVGAQLLIRDTSDIRMSASRCGADITIDSLRRMAMGLNNPNILLPGVHIRGTVVASYLDSNCVINNTYYVEDASGQGIELYTSAISLYDGDSVYIDLTGDGLNVYGGAPPYEITGITKAQAQIFPGAGTLQPKLITITEINTTYGSTDTLESTLVTIKNVTFSKGTFAGSQTISDGGPAGTIVMYTPNSATAGTATFANEQMPSGTHTVTGVLSSYTAKSGATTIQFSIRTPADIK